MKKTIIEMLGWLGVILILGAFTLNTFGVLSIYDIAYSLMNACGAVGIVVSSLSKKNLQPVVVNAAWFLVALVGIVRAIM